MGQDRDEIQNLVKNILNHNQGLRSFQGQDFGGRCSGCSSAGWRRDGIFKMVTYQQTPTMIRTSHSNAIDRATKGYIVFSGRAEAHLQI